MSFPFAVGLSGTCFGADELEEQHERFGGGDGAGTMALLPQQLPRGTFDASPFANWLSPWECPLEALMTPLVCTPAEAAASSNVRFLVGGGVEVTLGDVAVEVVGVDGGSALGCPPSCSIWLSVKARSRAGVADLIDFFRFFFSTRVGVLLEAFASPFGSVALSVVTGQAHSEALAISSHPFLQRGEEVIHLGIV